MRVLIVTGGRLDKDFARAYVDRMRESGRQFDRVIAADSGLDACDQIGIVPTDVLGDFDSIENINLVNQCRDKGIVIRTFPSRKDDTDTDLALQYVRELYGKTRRPGQGKCLAEYQQVKKRDKGDTDCIVTLLGATGTRMDHTLANIALLKEMAEAGIRTEILDAHNRIEMFHGPAEIHFSKEDDWPFLSLLAYSDQVTGITMEGFSYPLQNGELHPYSSLGISNEVTAAEGKLTFQNGYLLVVRARD